MDFYKGESPQVGWLTPLSSRLVTCSAGKDSYMIRFIQLKQRLNDVMG